MKKSILNVALLSMLFVLGACSAADEGDFLKKVEGKYVYDLETPEEGNDGYKGQFSTDGKTFNDTVKFDNTTDENTAEYNTEIAGKKYIYTFKTSDGKTGSYDVKVDGTSIEKSDIWLEETKRS